MPKFKHLTLTERKAIENYLNGSLSFKAIAKDLGRDCTTISKEVRKHITHKKTGAYGRAFNNCVRRFDCTHSYLCDSGNCRNRYYRFCSKCYLVCPDYEEYLCPLLSKPPYVCNGCKNLKSCTLKKSFYVAEDAHQKYKLLLSESRSGISVDEEEIIRLDNIISPLIKKGQSLHHICSNNRDIIMHSERTIYNYVDYGLFTARNIELPRKVVYRPRKKSADHFKVDKSCRVGRTYEDFINFLKEHPDTPAVEMDTVEGTKGGKVLLTIHFIGSQFMLAFIRDANTSQSVIDVFEELYLKLGLEVFQKLFPVILMDNGSEFSNPTAIEFDKAGNRRTYIFYCDPSSPYQKGAVENNHELIRRVIPKGHSFNPYQQQDITLMMNHINSYGRKKLNDCSPYAVFRFLYGDDILKKLGAELIPANEVILNPTLLRK